MLILSLQDLSQFGKFLLLRNRCFRTTERTTNNVSIEQEQQLSTVCTQTD